MSDIIDRAKEMPSSLNDACRTIETMADEIERLQKNAEHAWITAGMASQQRDDLRAELSGYANQNTNLRNDLVLLGMAKDGEIERLRAQLEGCKEMFAHTAERANEYVKAFQQQEGRLASARKALEPFAKIVVPDKCRNSLPIMGIDKLASNLTVGNLRAAKSALTDEKST